MDAQPTHPDWLSRVSARLQRQWPSIDRTRLDDLALELSAQKRWRAMEPERAAVEWLRQGIPNAE